jgi:hypothetical protein
VERTSSKLALVPHLTGYNTFVPFLKHPQETAMSLSPQDFVAKWKRVTSRERQTVQLALNLERAGGVHSQ